MSSSVEFFPGQRIGVCMTKGGVGKGNVQVTKLKIFPPPPSKKAKKYKPDSINLKAGLILLRNLRSQRFDVACSII